MEEVVLLLKGIKGFEFFFFARSSSLVEISCNLGFGVVLCMRGSPFSLKLVLKGRN